MFTLTRDDISPSITRLLATVQNKRPILQAMGTTFLSITQGAFNSVGAAYRPLPWPNKRDGTPSILQKSGTLAKSFHLEVTDETATVSNPMPYAAIHQYGGKTPPHKIVAKNKAALAFNGIVVKSVNHPGSNIPARPFYPVAGGRLTPAAEEKILAAARRIIERRDPTTGQFR